MKNRLVFSAGVGRSGTFIALDALLEAAERQETIDVLEFTHRMRSMNKSNRFEKTKDRFFLDKIVSL